MQAGNERLRLLSCGARDRADVELRLISPAGSPVDVVVRGTRLRYDEEVPVTRILCSLINVTERKSYEDQLQHMADHDPLTGLLNRRRSEAELDRHVANVKRYGPEGVLMMLDIDLEVAGDIVEAVRTHSALRGGEHKRVTASVGVALIDSRDGLTGEAVMVEADLAIYEAKDAGRDTHALYAGGEHHASRTEARFALDDFGAGFGSFYYLKHLPFDYIKIGGEFVRSAHARDIDRHVIEAVVNIANGLGKQTIAEFVTDERTEQLITPVQSESGPRVRRPSVGVVPGPPPVSPRPARSRLVSASCR